MEKITITEALSEINLIKKKLTAKQDRIKGALYRVEHLVDPFESEGGSVAMIHRESQSITDLNRRFAKIRASISRANLENEITIGEDTRSIHDWLIWKREISKGQIQFSNQIHRAIKDHRDLISKSPTVYKTDDGAVQIVKYTYHTDYAHWLKQDENLNEKLEQLDGKLSLKNATILVEI